MLAECLPQSDVIQAIDPMVQPAITNELNSPEEMDEKKDSITSIKIPLVSSQPILATSDTHILVNEHTKRRDQLVLIDRQFQRTNIRSSITEELLDAIWYEKEGYFLLLTPTNIYTLDPDTKCTDLIEDIAPKDEKIFKSFTLVNSSVLYIAYNEWNGESVDQWQQDENDVWKLIKTQSLQLTDNEFLGNMITIEEEEEEEEVENCLGITVYNMLTEEWRMEIRNVGELMVAEQKAVLLPKSNAMYDYRIIPIKNAQSDVRWLAFSSANSNIVSIDSEHKKQILNYRNPVQRMAIFNENYLIVRTRERVDVHLFV